VEAIHFSIKRGTHLFASALEALQDFLPPSILLPEGDGELLTSLVSGCQSAYKLAKLLQDVLKAISLLLPFNHVETAALNLGRASPMEQTPRILVTQSPGQTRKQEVQLSGPSVSKTLHLIFMKPNYSCLV
jgi:hypothetical protein